MNTSNNDGIGVFVFCNMDPSEYYEEIKNTEDMNLVQRFEKENLWIEIYTKE